MTRPEIIECVTEAVRPLSYVRAAWLGGSDASGRTDPWSDVDLQLLVEDDHVEDALAAVEAGLKTLGEIQHRLRFPQPTWHGHDQELLRVEGTEEFHFLDLVIMKTSSTKRFLEAERHGNATILFDHDGAIVPEPLDRSSHTESVQRRLPELRETFALLQSLTKKALHRGHVAEAMWFYLHFTIRPLVELIRIRHCPHRYDYGLRYLDRDIPSDLRAEIETLLYPGSADGLAACRERAEQIFRENLQAFDAGEWTITE